MKSRTQPIFMDSNLKTLITKEVEIVSKFTPICPFIMGEPGIGKSSFVRALCQEKGWHFFEVLCNQLADRSDLTGCRSVSTKETVNNKTEEVWKQIFFPHKDVQDAITAAKNYPNDIVILFLDEINRTSADITSAILSFTTARKVGSYVFPDNLRFITAGNDAGNITSLDLASLSRFAKFKVIPTAQTYMEIESNLNPYIKNVLTAHPELIFCTENAIVTSTSEDENGESVTNTFETFDDEAEGFSQITTPRTISGLNAFLNGCNQKELTGFVGTTTRDPITGEEASLLQTIVTGHVGCTEFADKLCAVIAEDISRGLMQKANNVPRPIMPTIYNDIKRCSDRQTRDAMLANMDNETMSPIIVYALYEKNVDNRDLVASLARNYNGQFLTGDCQPQMIALKSHDELDIDNYNALVESNTELGNMTKMLLGE